jgi:Putative Actinobacterial Holin-X, holin superfamily III
VSARNENGGSPVRDVISAPSTGGGQRPLGTVVASAVDGLRTLARKHVELVKIEASEAASVRGKGAGMFAAAGVVGMYAIGFAAAAGAAGLAVVLPVWAAILIVTVVLLMVAGVLVLIGRRTLRSAPPFGQQIRETMEEDGRWARQQISR